MSLHRFPTGRIRYSVVFLILALLVATAWLFREKSSTPESRDQPLEGVEESAQVAGTETSRPLKKEVQRKQNANNVNEQEQDSQVAYASNLTERIEALWNFPCERCPGDPEFDDALLEKALPFPGMTILSGVYLVSLKLKKKQDTGDSIQTFKLNLNFERQGGDQVVSHASWVEPFFPEDPNQEVRRIPLRSEREEELLSGQIRIPRNALFSEIFSNEAYDSYLFIQDGFGTFGGRGNDSTIEWFYGGVFCEKNAGQLDAVGYFSMKHESEFF